MEGREWRKRRREDRGETADKKIRKQRNDKIRYHMHNKLNHNQIAKKR